MVEGVESKKKRRLIKRRAALKWLAGSGAAAFIGRSLPIRAQSKTVRIGVLIPLTRDVDAYA